jgi:hypothetical protein
MCVWLGGEVIHSYGIYAQRGVLNAHCSREREVRVSVTLHTIHTFAAVRGKLEVWCRGAHQRNGVGECRCGE